jgi:hypothetical protein
VRFRARCRVGEESLTAPPKNPAGASVRPALALPGMSYSSWVFSFHLIFAAMLVGGLVMSWVVVVALYSANAAEQTLGLGRVAMVGTVAILLGLLGTITLGIWTAVLRPELRPWHGWAIAAIVLWAIATVALLRSFAEYGKPIAKARELAAAGVTGPSEELSALNRTTTGLLLRAVSSLAIVLIVIDMVYKPGA